MQEKYVYDSERILSIDWFKKSLRDVRSALGNRDIIASRVVLKKEHSKQTNHKKRNNKNQLFGNRH